LNKKKVSAVGDFCISVDILNVVFKRRHQFFAAKENPAFYGSDRQIKSFCYLFVFVTGMVHLERYPVLVFELVYYFADVFVREHRIGIVVGGR
jgi:hypothetical protein